MFKKKKIVAIIPARNGSKSIKNKNIKKLYKAPLIAYSIKYAKKSKYIDKVFVTTDGPKIAKISKQYNSGVIKRPKSLSNDKAMADDAVLHAINFIEKKLNYNFDYVVFLQPTSPLRKIGELDSAIKLAIEKRKDCVFSSNIYHPWLWLKKGKKLKPFSIKPFKLKRRQETFQVVDTGSYYVTKKKAFKYYKNRYGKNVINFVSDFHASFEIDELKDLKFISNYVRTNMPKKYKIFIP